MDVIHERLESLVYLVLSMRRSVRPAAETLACIRAMLQLEGTAKSLHERRTGVRFGDLAQVLDAFTTGLAGRRLHLEAGDETYTDTETIFVPASLSRFDNRADNFALYKSMIAHLWAQTWFGTWREPVRPRIEPMSDPRRGLALFQSLECLRLDARISRELPGLWREMERLGSRPALPPEWLDAAERMRDPACEVTDSWALVAELERAGASPLPVLCYQGELRPGRVAEVAAARIARERDMSAMVSGSREAKRETDSSMAGDAGAIRLISKHSEYQHRRADERAGHSECRFGSASGLQPLHQPAMQLAVAAR